MATTNYLSKNFSLKIDEIIKFEWYFILRVMLMMLLNALFLEITDISGAKFKHGISYKCLCECFAAIFQNFH